MKKQLAERKEFFTEKDINKNDNGYYEGKIVVLKQSRMNEFTDEYNNPQNQLFVARGGFGCSPITSGTAVMGRFISDDESCRMERYEVMGVLKNEIANELGYCSCGNEINDDLVMNSLSRKDNATYICKSCETKELEEEMKNLGLY